MLTNVDPDSEIAQEEIFGPVLVVIPFDDDDDAVRIANNSIYGLSGSVFGSQDRALAVARRIRTGTLSINGVTTSRRTRPSGLQAVRRGSRNGGRRARRVPGAQDISDAGCRVVG
ncbi:aldehyde dehydrogenase family protein [Mycobacterium xenopi 3993]|nr:aldehyde dehydrogenase family protein [Mycobacterium xenopi 3993]